VDVGAAASGKRGGRVVSKRAPVRPTALLRPVAPLLLYVVVWQALPSLDLVNSAFLPTPLAVGHALADLVRSWAFFDDLGTTLLRTVGGLVCGAAIGVPLGAAMALLPPIESFFNPIVKSTYSLPKTALIPLLILWFGIGSTTNVVAVILSTILPLVIYTYHGVQGAPRILIWSACAMGTSRRALVWHLFLPAALPDILTGLRIGLGFALVIAIAAEMIAAKAGIGKLMFQYGENGSYDYMFAAVAAVVGISWLMDHALVSLTNYLLRWQDAGVREEA
jgi:ABC-type nitrate/sulfonate/bicarbonate transport system permease component